jgi:hypothetical protein
MYFDIFFSFLGLFLFLKAIQIINKEGDEKKAVTIFAIGISISIQSIFRLLYWAFSKS